MECIAVVMGCESLLLEAEGIVLVSRGICEPVG